MTVKQWRGTDQELLRLRAAIERNCTCAPAQAACPAHAMLTSQVVLDHLLYVYRVRAWFTRAEGLPAA